MGLQPLVTVLVPSFNHEPFITQALDSLTSQVYANIEVLIVDDCSSDDSVERIREWMEVTDLPVQLIVNEENRGICGVLNQMVALAAGDLLVYLDTDDWMEPDRIQCHVDHFESLGPEVVAVYGDAELRDEAGRSMGETYLRRIFPVDDPPEGSDVFDRLLLGNFIPTPSVTVRRSAIVEIGGYDESLWYDDYDMWLRLSHRHGFSFCDRVVANYRILESSMSHSPLTRPAMTHSTISFLERWAESSDVLDSTLRRRWLANNLRRQACTIARSDTARARGALSVAQRLDASAKWTMVDASRVLALPGGPRLIRWMARSWSVATRAIRGASR